MNTRKVATYAGIGAYLAAVMVVVDIALYVFHSERHVDDLNEEDEPSDMSCTPDCRCRCNQAMCGCHKAKGVQAYLEVPGA